MNFPKFSTEICDAMTFVRRMSEDECIQNHMVYDFLVSYFQLHEPLPSKDSIFKQDNNYPDWDKAPTWANYWAMDKSHSAYFYANKPIETIFQWESRPGTESCVDHDADPAMLDTLNWKASLRARPVTPNFDKG